MADIAFEDILNAVQHLTPEQKQQLQAVLAPKPLHPTREELLRELEARRAAGAFDNVQSMRNQYANPAHDDLTDAQLTDVIHSAAAEWEQELDDFAPDDT